MGWDLIADFITDEFKILSAKSFNFEFLLFTKEGRRLEVQLNATTRRDLDINVIGVIDVGLDITEIRDQEQTLSKCQKWRLWDN